MIFVAMLMLVIGFAALVKGADVFVDGAAALAGKFGIPQLVIGLTIVAMGTSLPEAAVSITAGLKGNAGITVGNIVGSNILNILIILGVTALITNVAIQKSTFKYEIPYMLFITAVLLVMGATGNEITFVEGIVLWVLFIAYLIYLYFLAKKGNTGEDDNQSFAQYPLWKSGLFIVLGAVLVVVGSNFVVDGATTIARACGMSERFIGLTIVARKGNAGIAIGNIVGSNIFNILFVIGTVALICPVPFEGRFLIDTVVAILCGILLWAGTIRHRQLRRPCGVIMLLAYAGYFVYLLSLQLCGAYRKVLK